jgi:bifunctional DNA-binding transcriptional regulator/antitoxin component of YhaV-PrlF toxin-antitoxin module
VATQRFTAVLRKGDGGGHTIEVPLDVRDVFGEARPPVRGTVNGTPFRTRVAVYGEKYYLGFNREIRDAAGIGDGDEVEIELERDDDPREVEIPAAFAEALAAGGVRDEFEALSFTHRREYVRWIEGAKRDETRERRLAKAVEMLRDGVKTPG